MVILGGAGLILLVALWTVLMWARARSMRSLLEGIGLILLVAGAWITGILALALHGVRSIYDWAQRTVLDTTMVVGLVVMGLGLLSFLIGLFISPISKEEAKSRREVHRDARKSAAQPDSKTSSTSSSQAGVSSGKSPATGQTSAAPKQNTAAEDAEVEDILKSRGIE